MRKEKFAKELLKLAKKLLLAEEICYLYIKRGKVELRHKGYTGNVIKVVEYKGNPSQAVNECKEFAKQEGYKRMDFNSEKIVSL